MTSDCEFKTPNHNGLMLPDSPVRICEGCQIFLRKFNECPGGWTNEECIAHICAELGVPVTILEVRRKC